MRRGFRWFLVSVLMVNCVAAVVVGTIPSPSAATDGTAGANQEEPEVTRETLALLGQRLAERAAALEQREQELDELLRGAEVQLRLAEANAPSGEPAEPRATEQPAPADDPSFSRLQRAYENMEPDSAAAALAELAALDQKAVLQLLSGWKPRTSSQILDALTQIDPGLAARLSYEIWRKGGNDEPPAANSGR